MQCHIGEYDNETQIDLTPKNMDKCVLLGYKRVIVKISQFYYCIKTVLCHGQKVSILERIMIFGEEDDTIGRK